MNTIIDQFHSRNMRLEACMNSMNKICQNCKKKVDPNSQSSLKAAMLGVKNIQLAVKSMSSNNFTLKASIETTLGSLNSNLKYLESECVIKTQMSNLSSLSTETAQNDLKKLEIDKSIDCKKSSLLESYKQSLKSCV